MRKMEKKNKISFNVFGALIILVLAGFGFIAFQVIGHAQESYQVAKGSVIYDEKMQPVDVASNGTIEQKWNAKHYLTLNNGGSYCLGAETVLYNASGKQVEIVGEGYQVFTDGSVKNIEGKTAVKKDNAPRVYKLNDRNYLITGDSITAQEQDFETSLYLQVNIDKGGNALLTNDVINMKTIEPLVLVCGDLTFDVANEELKYAEQVVDLKAIGGSTNEYQAKEEVEVKEEDTTTEQNANQETNGSIVNNSNSSNNTSTSQTTTTGNQQNVIITGGTGGSGTGGSGTGGSGTGSSGTGGSGTGGSGTGGSGTGGSGTGGGTTKPGNTNLERSISLRGTSADVTSIKVDYSIVDVENKFISTYLLVAKNGSEEEEMRVELNKADTSMTIRDLEPNTSYHVSLCYDMYMVIEGSNTLVSKTENTLKTRTRSITSNIEVTKMTAKKMYVTVTLDSNYILDSANLIFTADDINQTLPIDTKKASRSEWTTEIDITGSNSEQFRLTIDNAYYQGDIVTLNAEYITRNSGVTRFINSLLQGFD